MLRFRMQSRKDFNYFFNCSRCKGSFVHIKGPAHVSWVIQYQIVGISNMAHLTIFAKTLLSAGREKYVGVTMKSTFPLQAYVIEF